MRNVAVHSLCACGRAAVWRKTPPRPEDAPEYAVCLLTDDDFADDYCEECFQSQVTLTARARWKHIDRQEKELMPDDIHKVDTAGTVEDEMGDTDYTNGSEEAPGQDSPGSVPDDASGSSGSEGQGRA